VGNTKKYDQGICYFLRKGWRDVHILHTANVARDSKTLCSSDCGKWLSYRQWTLTAEKTLHYPIFRNGAKA
jgi:hypothetical protein